MTITNQQVREAFFSAARAGAIFSAVYLVADMSAAFLVTGDGHASAFTYLMISLGEFPIRLLGLSPQGVAFPVSLFWGPVFGLGFFVYKIFRAT